MTATFTLIRGAQLHAPEPRGVQDMLLGAGRILAIAPDLDIGMLDARVLDARGCIATPGFVDSLVHIGGGGGEGGFATRMPPLDARAAFAAGVTTLIGALGTDDVTRSHADLLAHARALRATGLSAYVLTGSYRVPVQTLTGCVRRDLVLVPDVIGVGEIAIADHRGSHPGVDELARIAADARVGGMLAGKAGTVLLHVGDAPGAFALLSSIEGRHPVPATQWHPTHANRHAGLLDDARAWIARGGRVDLTASTTPALLSAGEVPAAAALARLLRGGAPASAITLSSDAQASLPHFDAAGRLLDLQPAPIGSLLAALHAAVHEHGVALQDALATLTCSPATVWGLPRKGRLAVGADADVLLLDADTLALRATFAGGREAP